MPATITTYYTFQPATKARSSQVNNNFSNHRGDVLPINENTASASNNTHFLGATDHYWAGAYSAFINMGGATTTHQAILQRQSAITTGGAEILFGSNTAAVYLIDQFKMKAMTSTVDPIFKVSQANTTGYFELLFGTSTITAWDSGGLQRANIDVGLFTTTSAPIGHYLMPGATTLTSISNLSTTGQTLTLSRINTRGGGVLEITIFGSRISGIGVQDFPGVVDFYRGTTTTSLSLIHSFSFVGKNYAGTSVTAFQTDGNLNTSYFDTGYSSGEVVIQTIVRSGVAPTTTAGDTFSISASLIIKEI